MTSMTRTLAPLILASIAACGNRADTATEPSTAPTNTVASGGEQASDAPASVAPSSQPAPSGFDVTGHAPNASGGFDVTGRSDLPETVPSTARPYNDIVEAAVAPLRAAIRECLAPMSPHALPRFYAISVEPDGSLHARTPQPIALPSRATTCAEAVLNGTTVNPPPPRSFPYDLHIEPDRSH